MKAWLTLLLSLPFALAACDNTEAPCAALIGGGTFCLQATNALAPFELQQKVDARFRDRRETVIANIENDSSGLQFVGLTPLGQKIFHVSYDNQNTSATMIPDRRINPTLLVALLQIALWPTERIRAGLEAPFMLEESGNQRRIVHRGETTLAIDYSGEAAPYRHMRLHIPAADLELHIETLPANGNRP